MTDFDFTKPKAQEERSGIFGKKNIIKTPRVININVNFASIPRGMWAILTAAASLFCMHANVPDAGWGLFLAFFMLDKKDALIPFLLAALGLAGMYHGVEGAGWALFFAFLCI